MTEETQSVSSVAGGDEDNVELAEELRAALAGEVLADPLNRAFYSTDASVHQVRPLLAVVPAGAEGVTAAVRIAARRGVPIAPHGVPVANPAFDVTPHRYVTGIITEEGIVYPPFDLGLRQVKEKAGPYGA